MNTVSAIAPGKTLLHYRIVRKLGAGGMGTVYEAEDTRLGRSVAIKVLHDAQADDLEARERFLREARAVAAIEHRNLSNVHAIEETPDGMLLLVMTLYRGRTLADLIRSGPLSADQIVSIGTQAAAGLHEAHMAGVLHRDIKPPNIFITAGGDVKILDFGLARLIQQSQLTQPNQVMGTLAYMAPEQLTGGHVDYRSDLWALGAVLYEMAASHPPFHHPSHAAVIALISKGDYLPLSRLRPDLPVHVQEAIHCALCVDAKQRHSSARDFARMLSPVSEDTAELTQPLYFARDAATATIDLGPGQRSHRQTAYGDSSARKFTSSHRSTAIAVLPFVNMSADAENEYFSDGLTDDLITALGLVPGLSVVSRSSAFAFKGKGKDLQEIGETLHVEIVLEGSVRKSGKKVRVSVHMSEISSGFEIWASRFDRELRDVFELQDELTDATVQAIRERLAPDLVVPAHPLPKRQRNAEAYDTYLKGRFYWNQKTIEGVQLAGRYFEEALRLDDAFADAHAGLADYYSLLGSLGIRPPDEAWPEARASAMHAMALDPDLPEAHLALASVLQFYDWNWEEGRKELEVAIALRPERGESYVQYAYYLMTQGLLHEALKQTRKGLSYDPLSPSLLAARALLQTYLGDHESSILLARESLKAVPHYEMYYALGLACGASGRAQEAVAALQQGLELSRMPLLLGWLAEAHVKDNNKEQAENVLSLLLAHADKGNELPVSIAVAATALGKFDLAFKWLDIAADRRDILIGYLNIMPSLERLRSDERYHRLAKRMNLHRAAGVAS
jgi:serine/threonine protein kinase/tetratricopeptide (TPR) repeat protein